MVKYVYYTKLCAFSDNGQPLEDECKRSITTIDKSTCVTAAHCLPKNSAQGNKFYIYDQVNIPVEVMVTYFQPKSDYAILVALEGEPFPTHTSEPSAMYEGLQYISMVRFFLSFFSTVYSEPFFFLGLSA